MHVQEDTGNLRLRDKYLSRYLSRPSLPPFAHRLDLSENSSQGHRKPTRKAITASLHVNERMELCYLPRDCATASTGF
jgi:hypothetical protein